MAILHRLAVVSFGQKIENVASLSASIGSVQVTLRPASHEGKDFNAFIAIASHSQDFQVSLNHKQQVIVPTEFRSACEYAIEEIANLISISHSASRTISSPGRAIALSKLSAQDSETLAKCVGLASERRVNVFADLVFDFLDQSYLLALSDRSEGVAILAETFSTTHATSKCREYVRLFELAFARPFTEQRKILPRLLSSSGLGYTRSEVDEWANLRHGANHADLKVTKSIVFERDVSHIIHRMEQAAYDVLFNKTIWHSPDVARRNLFRPRVATKDEGRTPVMTRGQQSKILFSVSDEFGGYPQYPGDITIPIEEWWYPPLQATLSSGAFEIVDQ